MLNTDLVTLQCRHLAKYFADTSNMRNVPHSHKYLNTCSPVGGAVSRDLGGMAFLGDGHPWGPACPIPAPCSGFLTGATGLAAQEVGLERLMGILCRTCI